MGRVVNVLVHDHDPLYVALAAFVCVVGCVATLNVLDRAKLATGQVQAAWLCAGALAGGVGVWATHFVAMLGFHNHLTASYDIALTAISAIVAVLVLGIGFTLPFWLGMRHAVVIPSGALVGLGIGAMHYLGMAAYQIDLIVTWDTPLVVASLILGAGFAALALEVEMREGKCSWSRRAGATALLVVAIVALHFTAMAALEVPPHDHFTAELGGSSGWLAGSVALASIMLASLGLLTAGFDQRIAVSRTRFLAAIEAMQDGFVLYDAEDRLVMCNEAFRSMHAPVRHMIAPGRTFEEITRAAAAAGLWAEAVGREEEWIAERVARRRCDGSQLIPLGDGRWILQRDQRTPDGETVGIRADVTTLKQREAELAAAKEKAVLAERAKSEFLANMSHEIRTPMNGVMGMAELLANTDLDAKQRTFADVIVKSGNALLTIINDILDFSKIDAGQLVLDPRPFALAEAVEDVAALVSARAETKGLELAVRIQPGLPERVVGDVGRFRQIVTNLVGNAVKFTEAGHVLIDVSGTVAGQMADLLIKIVDTGIGIPPEKIDTIFEQFSQVDGSSTRKHEGTGLGLTISKLLVEKMGGRIGVESRLGGGSTFWFTVPLRVHGKAERVNTVPGDASGARILIIDDNEVNRAILLEQLASWRFEAVAVESGSAGLAALRQQAERGRAYELVVLDYQMPGIDGAQVAQAMRSEPPFAAVPIVMLTSVDQPSERRLLDALGVEAFLTKPARASQLLDTLVSVLHTARQRAADAPPSTAAEPDAANSDPGTNRVGAGPNARAAAAPDPACAAGPGPAGERRTVLVAEDNDVNRLVVEQILSEGGYAYDLAENGEEALAMWRARRPALVLMDVSMPVMNGLEATRAIRAAEAAEGLAGTPIVGLTAHALKGDREMCLAAGMDDYIAKPISPGALTAKMAEWLAKEGGRASAEAALG